MSRRWFIARFTLAGLALVAAAVRAAAEASAGGNADAELASLGLAPLRTWEITGSWRGSFGHKENLLLSAVRSENSAFVQGEAEVFWWRLPTERFEALAFANASLVRFVRSDENPREWQAFAHGEARWFLSPLWQATAAAEGYHLDQVFDLSATTAEHVVARLAVTGVLAHTALRWQFRPDTWLELKPAAQRDRYRGRRDDNAQQFVRMAAGRSFAAGRFELVLAGQALRRTYDRRPQYDRGGVPRAGSTLVFEQREGELTLNATWDRAGHWTSTTTATLMNNRDNGPGFFDYEHRAFRHEIAWTRPPWRIHLTGKIGRYDYSVQQVGVGIQPVFREKEESLVQLRLERELHDRARLFAEVLAERSRSNDPLARYDASTTSAGLEWSF